MKKVLKKVLVGIGLFLLLLILIFMVDRLFLFRVIVWCGGGGVLFGPE